MLSEISHTFLGLFCHHDPAICLQHSGLESLCPRCIAMHGSFLVGSLIFTTRKHWPFKLLLLILAASVAEWLLAHLGLTTSTTLTRILSGSFAGISLGLMFRHYYNDARLEWVTKLAFAAVTLFVISFLIFDLSLSVALAVLLLHSCFTLFYILIMRVRNAAQPNTSSYEIA